MQPANQYIVAKFVERESEPHLPTYEEATRQSDCSKLPSYNNKRRARFHPYSRHFPIIVDQADRLFVRFLPALFLCVLITSSFRSEYCF